MKIAILQHYRLNSALNKTNTAYEKNLIAFIATIFKTFTYQYFDVISGKYPLNINEYDLYIFPGSAASTYEDLPWISKECQFIKTLHQHRRPMLGLCFGHQMISQALGGKVQPCPFKWQGGIQTYDIIGAEPWMKPIVSKFNAYTAHQDYVSIKPPNAAIFGSNSKCPIAGFSILNHILSFQMHPEINKQIMESFMAVSLKKNISNKHGIASAQKTLGLQPDKGIIGSWINQFFSAYHASH